MREHITFTLGELENMTSYALQFGVLKREGVPNTILYQLARFINKANDELKPMNDIKNNLLEKYGKRDENGELILDERGNVDIREHLYKYKKEVDKLSAQEVELLCPIYKESDFTDTKWNGEDYITFIKLMHEDEEPKEEPKGE